jgi:hypothetical protein
LIRYLVTNKIDIYKTKNNKLSTDEKKQIINSYNELYEFIKKNKFKKIISVFENFELYISSNL